MIAKLKFFLFLSLAQFCVSYVSAQTNYTPLDLKSAPRYWVDTINAKYKQFTQLDNFLIYKQTSSLLNKNSEMPIMIQLFKGRMYHFLIFADPLTTKVEMKLGMRGVGHIITDKFYPMRDGAFYTEFSYVCSKDGIYLLTIYQRSAKKKLNTHIAVLQKERLSTQLEFGY